MPAPPQETNKLSPGFSREFWLANLMELFERAAYYGFFIVLTLYLTNLVGFTDKETGFVAGIFFAGLYFLPPFAGAIADVIGFKRGLILAFSLLGVGYFFLGVTHHKALVILLLGLIMIGGSFIKPLITGTVAKTTTPETRARGFALFYWVVNIGAFSGKTFVPFIRQRLGLAHVNYFSAGMAGLALLVAAFVFKPASAKLEPGLDGASPQASGIKDVLAALKNIFSNGRLVALTVIVAGFWTIQHQLYATMPKYVIRLLGEQARPEWLANVNPLVVVLLVVQITHLMRQRRAVSSMLVGMLLMPFSALAMALSTTLERLSGPEISLGLFSLHPLTVMMIVGIAIQGLAECFISPRFLEYFSRQAPKGEEGLYLGFSHLHSFLSALAGFIMSGFLLDTYCPDPHSPQLSGLSPEQLAERYAHAHYIWYYFAIIGLVAAIALLVFRQVTDAIDRKQNQPA